jgi:hypothetical protein
MPSGHQLADAEAQEQARGEHHRRGAGGGEQGVAGQQRGAAELELAAQRQPRQQPRTAAPGQQQPEGVGRDAGAAGRLRRTVAVHEQRGEVEREGHLQAAAEDGDDDDAGRRSCSASSATAASPWPSWPATTASRP